MSPRRDQQRTESAAPRHPLVNATQGSASPSHSLATQKSAQAERADTESLERCFPPRIATKGQALFPRSVGRDFHTECSTEKDKFSL